MLNFLTTKLYIKYIRSSIVSNITFGEISTNLSKTFIINNKESDDHYLVHYYLEGTETNVYYKEQN